MPTFPNDEDNPNAPLYNPQPSHGQLVPYPGHPGYFYNPYDPFQKVWYKNPDGSYTEATGNENQKKEPTGPPGGGGGGFGGGGGGGGGAIIDPATINAWLHIGNVYGVPVSREMVIHNIQKGMPFETWQNKILSVHELDDKKDWFDQGVQAAKAQGLNNFAKRLGTVKGRLEAINGLAEPQFYDWWHESSLRGVLAEAGVDTFNKGKAFGDDEIRRKDILKTASHLAGMTEDQIRAIAQGYASLALASGSYNRLLGGGLSHKDFLSAAEGRGSAGTNAKIATLQMTQQAFQTAKFAAPRLASTSGGGTTLLGVEDQQGQTL